MHIGNRLQELRKLKEINLTELAEKSGVQIATLSRIENSKMVGTLESHINIAKALGIDVTQLYTDIIREESKAESKSSKNKTDVFIHNDKSGYEVLTTKMFEKKMMPMLIKLEPGARTPKEQNQVGTEKFVFILEGKSEAKIGAQNYSLRKNNTLYFDASMEHYFTNTGKSPLRAICVATPVVL